MGHSVACRQGSPSITLGCQPTPHSALALLAPAQLQLHIWVHDIWRVPTCCSLGHQCLPPALITGFGVSGGCPTWATHGPGQQGPHRPPQLRPPHGAQSGMGLPSPAPSSTGAAGRAPRPWQVRAAGQALSHLAASPAHPAWLIPKAPLPIGPGRLTQASGAGTGYKAACQDGDTEQARHACGRCTSPLPSSTPLCLSRPLAAPWHGAGPPTPLLQQPWES